MARQIFIQTNQTLIEAAYYELFTSEKGPSFNLILCVWQDVIVETPQGIPYRGKRCTADKICGVSILRAGETMEQAFSDVCKDTRIGKILIQTNRTTDEPEV